MPHRWSTSANLRREQIESGKDITFNQVFVPFFIERLKEISPQRILELGAGTGHLAKEVAGLGQEMTALEPSEGMYDVARDVLKNSNVTLSNDFPHQAEAKRKYDVAISHLVAHSVEDLNEFFKSVSSFLTVGGRFICTIPHPCFYNDYKGFFGHEYNYMLPIKKDVAFTITKDQENAIGNVPYNHRPLSQYINTLTDAGLLLERFDEIYPEKEVQELYGSLWETPRYCAFTGKKL